jgi:thiamine-monophosphate kinase
MARLSEDDLIARHFAPLATLAGADGLRDDAALIEPPPGMAFVVTVDALVAAVHFLPDDPPATIAQKSLRVNLSDLAAKGATPFGFLLSLSLPDAWTNEWLEAFGAGLAADVATYRFPLIGGDTVRTPGPLTLSVTAFGLVPAGRIPRRSGARPGDALFVSGTIGDGALGLRVRRGGLAELDAADRDYLVDRYRLPRPRVGLAKAVLHHASASMDLSDGFVGDLRKMLRVSGASAMIDLAKVPLSQAAHAAIVSDPGLFDVAVTGGDDYEILCAVPEAAVDAFVDEAAKGGVAVTRVGVVTEGPAQPAFLLDGRERVFASASFSHF